MSKAKHTPGKLIIDGGTHNPQRKEHNMTTTTERMIIGYHFTGATLRDGRPIPAIGD